MQKHLKTRRTSCRNNQEKLQEKNPMAEVAWFTLTEEQEPDHQATHGHPIKNETTPSPHAQPPFCYKYFHNFHSPNTTSRSPPKSTVEMDGEVWIPRSDNQRQRCRQQIQRQDFSHYDRFLSQSMRSVLTFRGIENRPEKHLQECCQQLQRVDRQSQCEALEEVVRQQKEEEQQGEYGSGCRGRSQQVRQRARLLQSQCRLPECCDI